MLERLQRESTEDTPYVVLDKENGEFEISGNSFPSNASEFFDPVKDWIEQYVEDPNEETVFDFRLHYFNSTSAKYILEILVLLRKIDQNDRNLKILWHYNKDDEEMQYAGKELSNLSHVPFEYDSY